MDSTAWESLAIDEDNQSSYSESLTGDDSDYELNPCDIETFDNDDDSDDELGDNR